MPHQHAGKFNNLVSYAADIHQLAGHEEKRDGKHCKTVCAVDHSLNYHGKRISVHSHVAGRGDSQREGNRNSQHHKDNEYQKEDSKHHLNAPPCHQRRSR